MARQSGIIKLEGTLGDIVFYKTADGYLAREKGGIDANRMATDPAFQRTRENGAEFGRAGKAGKMLRNSLRALLIHSKDRKLVARLTKAMVEVVRADAVNERGLRNVIDGEAELLSGFEFNGNANLGSTMYAPFTSTIDRATGEITVDVPSFIPLNMLSAPSGTTHFKIISGGSEIDFEAETYIVDTAESAVLALDGTATAVISLENQVTAASTKPLFLALGIIFYQDVNGTMYPLKNGAYNPVALVNVSGL